MEGSYFCNGNGMMGFGENSSSRARSGGGLCPCPIMPSLVTCNHHPINPNPNEEDTNTTLFLPNPNPIPMPCNTNNNTPIMLHNSTGLGHLMEIDHNNNNDDGSSSSSSAVKAKIMAHPHYHRLLTAYVNCQKIGAPAEVVGRLEEACACAGNECSANSMGEDPALDQFMEAYCEMLIKYEQQLSKPFHEAMLFLQRIDSHFKSLTISSSHIAAACNEEASDRNGSSEDVDVHNNIIDPQAEDQGLKVQLLRKYSGCLGNLKQEFMKKKKKGKLPKEARHKLLEWWSRHYKWPYPSESQKLALAESTGLDQKQINNWFINQRKRHWKPSEDMQFVVVDPNHPHYYMHNVLGNPFPMDLSHTML